MAAMDQLTGLMQILNMGKGGTTKQTSSTSGGSQTQQTNLSDAAVQEQIKNILAGSGGVRDIGNSARRAGLYNSTTEELLLSNLYATAAAQGEIARAPTTVTSAPTTTTTKTEAPKGAGIQDAIVPLLAMGAISKGFDMLPSIIGGITGGSDPVSKVGGAVARGAKAAADDPLLGSTDFDFSLADGIKSFGASIGSGGWSGNVRDTSNSLGQFNSGMGSMTGSTASGNVGRRGNDDGFDLTSAIGGGLGSLFGGGGLGGLLGSVMGGFGGGSTGGRGGSSGGSVICTALQEIGELDAELYKAGSEYLAQLDPLVVVGYQIWAIKVADRIRKGSKLAKAICRPLARSRTALLATRGSALDHLKHPLGSLTKFVGEPVCRAIGWCVVNLALFGELQASLTAK